MRCSNCTVELYQDSRFCHLCGHRMDDAAPHSPEHITMRTMLLGLVSLLLVLLVFTYYRLHTLQVDAPAKCAQGVQTGLSNSGPR